MTINIEYWILDIGLRFAFKIKVRVESINTSSANISKMVTDVANIIIAIEY